jgi:hypothetical protein
MSIINFDLAVKDNFTFLLMSERAEDPLGRFSVLHEKTKKHFSSSLMVLQSALAKPSPGACL